MSKNRFCLKSSFFPTSFPNSFAYQLVSTCEHIGEVINDGHYVAHILSRENTWWRANDDQPLERSKMADVEASTVFLLQLVEDESISGGYQHQSYMAEDWVHRKPKSPKHVWVRSC